MSYKDNNKFIDYEMIAKIAKLNEKLKELGFNDIQELSIAIEELKIEIDKSKSLGYYTDIEEEKLAKYISLIDEYNNILNGFVEKQQSRVKKRSLFGFIIFIIFSIITFLLFFFNFIK